MSAPPASAPLALRFEVLAGHHDRAAFECGVGTLDLYLQRYARQNAKRDYGVTFVAVQPDAPAGIVAFYTLANSKIEPLSLPAAAKLPPLDAPTVLLARLAVDIRFQGQGIGELCLTDVFRRVLALAATSGVAALEVDALDERAARFYTRFGFAPLHDSPLHLYLPTARIREFVARLATP